MISRIELTNFKSFHRAGFDLGPLTLLVGANASGKSNIRDALRVLHGIGLGYTLPEILGGKYGPGGILQWRGIRGGVREAASYGHQRFTLRVRASSALREPPRLPFPLTSTVEVDTSSPTLGPRVSDERFVNALDMLYDSSPPDDPLSQEAEHEIRVRHPRGGSHRKHGKVSRYPSNRPVLAQAARSTKESKALRGSCEDLLQVLSSVRFLDLDPDAMREASPPGQSVLGDRGENLSSVLQAICRDEQRKAALLSWVRSLTPLDARNFSFKLDLQGRVLVYLEEAGGQHTSAVSASDGTLRFLALVAALLGPDSGKIYFFEEFDNGIHPTRLHLLLELVHQACREQGVQVIATTHNPALLAFLDPSTREDAVLVYRPDGASDSRLRRIGELPEVNRVLESQDLGRLHTSGWLEDAAVFSEDPPKAASAGGREQ